MRIFTLLALTILAVFTTGCGEVLSTEPLAFKEDTLFDAGLIGTWFDREDTAITVTSETAPVYEILVIGTENGETFRLKGQLVRFGEHRILDVTDAEAGLFGIHAHSWVYVRKTGNGIQIQYLDSKYFQAKVRQSGLPQFTADGHPVLTAPTEKLQQLVRLYGLEPEARGGTMDLVPFKRKN